MKLIKVVLILSGVMLFLTGCHSKAEITFDDLGKHNAGKTVLVAGELSEFRYSVIQDVAANIPYAFFEIVTFNDAKAVDLATVDAVIIVDQNEAWMMMNGQSKRLMKKVEPSRIIPFITAGDPDWTWQNEKLGIEAVTGPSEQPRKQGMVEEITSRLKKILNP